VNLGEVGQFAESPASGPNLLHYCSQVRVAGLVQGSAQALELERDDIGSFGLDTAASEQMGIDLGSQFHSVTLPQCLGV